MNARDKYHLMYVGFAATFVVAVMLMMATGDDRWSVLGLLTPLVFGALQQLIRCPNCRYRLGRMGTMPSGPLIAPKRCTRCGHNLTL